MEKYGYYITIIGLFIILTYSITKILHFYGVSTDIYGIYIIFYIFIILSIIILPHKITT
jgi:hypothetical protein